MMKNPGGSLRTHTNRGAGLVASSSLASVRLCSSRVLTRVFERNRERVRPGVTSQQTDLPSNVTFRCQNSRLVRNWVALRRDSKAKLRDQTTSPKWLERCVTSLRCSIPVTWFVASRRRTWLNSARQRDIFTGSTSSRFCQWCDTLRNGVVILLRDSQSTGSRNQVFCALLGCFLTLRFSVQPTMRGALKFRKETLGVDINASYDTHFHFR